MTEDALTRHRLAQLEELATGWREAERRVDGLTLTIAALEKAVTEMQAEMRKNDDHARASMARLHQRLDEVTHSERFEQGVAQGEKDASSRTWKVIAWSVSTTIAFGLLIVAALNFALH